MTRARGYLPDYSPHAKTRALLDQVQAVLDEYRAFWPLTVRQVFYRLVGRFGYDKTERAYERLTEHMNNARRAELVPWEAITDNSATIDRPNHIESEEAALDLLQRYARNVTLDRLVGQDYQVLVWCEAAGMVGQLAQVAHTYSIPVFSGGGFDSTTRRHEIAEEIEDDGRDCVLLHFGDYDPSGEAAFLACSEDIEAYLREDAPSLYFTSARVALTGTQVAELGVVTSPPKPTDSRTRNWQAQKEEAGEPAESAQLEALTPDVINGLLRDAIEGWIDLGLVDRRRTESLALRTRLMEKLA